MTFLSKLYLPIPYVAEAKKRKEEKKKKLMKIQWVDKVQKNRNEEFNRSNQLFVKTVLKFDQHSIKYVHYKLLCN